MAKNVFQEENIQGVILKLGVPAMLGQLATLIYNMADTYFVSLTNSPAQIAAVTLSTPILLIIMSISSVCGMGGSSVIARLLGEQRTQDAKSTVTFCFYTMAVAGVIVLAAGLALISRIAGLAGADVENMVYTCDYLKWIFIGAPAIILSNGLVHIFRSTGLIREAAVSVVIGNGINIVLDWLFIVRLHMGTAGAALATSVGFLCATIYALLCMLHPSGDALMYSLSPSSIRGAKVPVGDIVKIGIPGALITIMLSVSNIVLNNYIGIYGSDSVAAYGIAYKIDMFPIMLSVGLSQGVAPLIGYCYGAKQSERMGRIMKNTMIDEVILGALFTGVFLALSVPLVSFFLHDEALISKSALFLRILCLSAPMLGIINTVTSYYQALGRAKNSLLITMSRNVILFIPCVILLNALAGLRGTVSAQPVVETILAAVCLVMYLSGKQKETRSETNTEGNTE